MKDFAASTKVNEKKKKNTDIKVILRQLFKPQFNLRKFDGINSDLKCHEGNQAQQRESQDRVSDTDRKIDLGVVSKNVTPKL